MPGNHHAAGVTRGVEALIHGAIFAGAIDADIHTALACIRQNLSDGIHLPGVDDHVGSELQGEFAAVRQRFDGPHAPCTIQLQRGNGEKADRSGSEHQRCLSRAHGCKVHGMQDDGEGLHQRSSFKLRLRGSGIRFSAGRFTVSRKNPGSPGVLKNRKLLQTL